MSNVWIFHHYATVPYRNGYIRPYRFATQLIKQGIHTTVFCSSYHHWSGENTIEGKELSKLETVDDVDFLYIKTPSSAAGGWARIKNMFCFARRVKKVAKRVDKKYRPDIIIASSPHPLTMIAGIRVGKKFKVPCVCEIRDLWPEAIFYGSKLKEKSLIGRLLVAGEHWIYRHADALIFAKEGDTDYLKERGWLTDQGGDIDLGKCFYINNGIEFDQYRTNITENVIEDSDLEDDSFKVIYTGAIRPVNNVRNIVEAAMLLKDDNNIRFLIYGDGNQKEDLEKLVEEEKLTNVKFKAFVENKYIPYVLSKSCVNLLNYSSKNYNWARGNSSNKLFEYLASGKPVISTLQMGYSIIRRYQCGIEMAEQTPEGLAKAIMSVKNMPNDKYNEMCQNALKGAKEFDYKKLTERLIKAMQFAREKYDK